MLAEKLAGEFNGAWHVSGKVTYDGTPDAIIENTTEHIRDVFLSGHPVVGICSTGIILRALGAHLASKHTDAPVLAVSEDGKVVIPLLGGHHGGNVLAEAIAGMTGGMAAITTAGDRAHGIALDVPPVGIALGENKNITAIMAALLAGEKAVLSDDVGHELSHVARQWREWLAPIADDNGTVKLHLSLKPGADFHPRYIVMGLGAARNCPRDEMEKLVEDNLQKTGIAPQSIAGVYSTEVKADEAAILHIADMLGVELRVFTSSRLERETPRLPNPSQVVMREVGSHGVAEAAALAAAGKDGVLLLPKTATKNATMALALRVRDDAGEEARKCGCLMLVGIGPGEAGWRTPEATAMIASADELVGYGFYIDLLGTLAAGKPRRDFGLGEEEARCRYGLDEAAKGRDIALICSGDAGIYAMAALVYELLDRDDTPPRVEIITAPGISALQAAAARSGAMLGHDFCAISLSDLLTPWEQIEARIVAAAAGDFVIAFYNPVSSRRREGMEKAKAILLDRRAPTTPVVLARNLGRADETITHCDLGALEIDAIDMMTLVLVGATTSRRMEHGGRISVYTPRGYEKKMQLKEVSKK